MAATMSFRHHNPNEQHYPPPVNMELVPNPHFTFPAQPSGDVASAPTLNTRRPASMHSLSSSLQSRPRALRQSASALPTFSFNESDTSGLVGGALQPPPSGLTVPPSPSKSIGHRRGVSELVGGDARFGLASVVATSPSKLPGMLPIPDLNLGNGSPSRRRGHAHRRSTAISSHDLTTILQPRDANVQSPTGSAPQTPTDRFTPLQYFSPSKPVIEANTSDDNALIDTPLSGTAITEDELTPVRPPSRLRVGFSENVEYIPRPLSTVSSDTGSASTWRGHSVANSMSSMISLGGIGSPSPRRMPIPTNNLADDISPRSRPSAEYTKATESDNQAVRPRNPRPLSESFLLTSSLPTESDFPVDPPRPSKKKNFLKLDRRRSEPLISLTASMEMGTSTISLQEPMASDENSETSDANVDDLCRKSSRKRVKQWASSILGRKGKDVIKSKSNTSLGEQFGDSNQIPDSGTEQFGDEEPDLDALFSQDPFTDGDEFAGSVISPRVGTSESSFPMFVLPSRAAEDTSPVIDLDAALGPYGTPSMSWESCRATPLAARRQLHSSRLAKDFVGPGMHYHRRTESAPALVPFEFGRSSPPGQSPMADVFEEEEDATDTTGSEDANETEEELGTGIQIVDAANEQDQPDFDWSFEDGLGIEGNGSGRAAPFFGLAAPRLSTPPEVRRTSVVEDTIIEEASPIEIVQDDEEPRTSSLTKSSDSSDSTVMASHNALVLPIPQHQNYPLTPTSYATSTTFSSPDFSRHQESFDVTRLGTSASSIGDNRTMSSFATGEHGPEVYMSSADDVPSLTSSRSTMISTMYQGTSRREFSDRPGSVACSNSQAETQASERRRKRSSIQSLSKLMGSSFGESRSKLGSERRPHTAMAPSNVDEGKRKKENRLSRLMFWRSKSESRTLFQS